MSFLGTKMDFSGVKNSFVQGSTQKGGFDAGDGVNAALDAAASAIPFGSIAKGFLDKLGLSENIGLVTKYGLSSWGASGSPEQMQQFFAEGIFPFFESKLKSINHSNIEQIFNEIEKQCAFSIQWFKMSVKHHSKAKSTRLGNEWAVKTYTELRDKFRSQVSNLKSQGFIITSRQEDFDVNSSRLPRLTNEKYITTENTKVSTINVRQYSIKVPKEGVEVNEKGEIVKKSSGSLGVLAAIAFGAFKLMK